MKKAISVAVIFGVLAFVGYRWYSEHQFDQFVKAKKSEFLGYRVEHLERERLIFLHSPNGDKRGVELAGLRRVWLYRINAADSTFKQNGYFWIIDGPPLSLQVPYFSVEPSVILQALKKEHTEINIEWSLKRVSEFERDKFNFCTIWAEPATYDYSKEKGYNEYGANYCDREKD